MGKFPNDRLQGTLDLLILKILASRGATHGYAITSHIQSITEDALRIEEGSLYPALHRMEQEGWISAEWGVNHQQPARPLLRHHRQAAGVSSPKRSATGRH